MSKLVAYYRVSTKKQGDRGLGIDAQRSAAAQHTRSHGGTIIAEFIEVESGRKTDRQRPELARALEHARLARATLLIAKLDRLARNVFFLAGLMKGHVPFICCDNPHATPLTIHILAAVAEDEATRISARTTAALQAYKDHKRISKRNKEKYPGGVPADVVEATAGKLGASLPQCRNLTSEARMRGHRAGTKAAAELAADRAAPLLPVVKELRDGGKTLRAIAAELNDRGYVTSRNKPWSDVAVLRLLNRC
jgi:DNA invertase Pin-like site-specific DNA recombinase